MSENKTNAKFKLSFGATYVFEMCAEIIEKP
jgi:hypothetical protein